jgi:hypothetical protein
MNPKTEIEPRIRLRQGFLLRQGFGGQDDGQVSRMRTDDERVMETIFKPEIRYSISKSAVFTTETQRTQRFWENMRNTL